MTLTIELSPEIESQLHRAAAERGQDVETFAKAVIVEASDRELGASRRPTIEEFDAFVDEISAGSEVRPPISGEEFSRANIYRDHD